MAQRITKKAGIDIKLPSSPSILKLVTGFQPALSGTEYLKGISDFFFKYCNPFWAHAGAWLCPWLCISAIKPAQRALEVSQPAYLLLVPWERVGIPAWVSIMYLPSRRKPKAVPICTQTDKASVFWGSPWHEDLAQGLYNHFLFMATGRRKKKNTNLWGNTASDPAVQHQLKEEQQPGLLDLGVWVFFLSVFHISASSSLRLAGERDSAFRTS